MCKSRAEGGQRCAAHTRPAYESAVFGTNEWDDAAAQFASTPTGNRELLSECDRLAAAMRDWEVDHVGTRISESNLGELHALQIRWAALGKALNNGEDVRAANAEAARIFKQVGAPSLD
jgi:hypothetical protein